MPGGTAPGQAYFINDAEPVNMFEFTRPVIDGLWRASAAAAYLRRRSTRRDAGLAAAALPVRNPPAAAGTAGRRTAVSRQLLLGGNKATRDLGYRPLFTTEQAMAECLPYYTDLFDQMKAAGADPQSRLLLSHAKVPTVEAYSRVNAVAGMHFRGPAEEADDNAGTVLVTGAFGLVGSETVRQLMVEGSTRRRHRPRRAGQPQIGRIDAVRPSCALGRPHQPRCGFRHCYEAISPDGDHPPRRDHSAGLLRPAGAGPSKSTSTRRGCCSTPPLPYRNPPRFVQASSVATYGARNPHRVSDVLTADTPLRPSDIYGSPQGGGGASWCARPGWSGWCCGWAACSPPRRSWAVDLDTLFFEASLPIDGRIQTVDVRDVARAFIAATTAPVVGETLLIGGDDSHRLVQGDLAPSMAAAMGLVCGIPTGRKGNPDNDANWFGTDWMDTTRSVEALDPINGFRGPS